MVVPRHLLAVLAMLLQIAVEVAGDWEHSCSYNDYYGSRNARRLSLCGQRLTEYVVNKCGGNVYMGSDSEYNNKRRKRDIVLSKEQASSYLRSKRSMRQGIVCECCINSCTVQEFEQYCDHKRKRRSIKEVIVGAPPSASTNHFSEEDVKKLYEQIDELSVRNPTPTVLSLEEIRKMEELEHTKQQNIDKEHQANMAAAGVVVEPPAGVSNSEENERSPHRQIDLSSLIANSLSIRHSKSHST